ncbi:helix-turn-helix domain-containing protein [Helicobacter himalayensis]|uniref:helix-turn-helix domain-containing protein n=1 Tax=Helicobacter himalayensis TaxID=1591088 RepID=UPI000829A7D8|nr:helix-turn-helix domain-containing protein [Helicobacter himalayensis]
MILDKITPSENFTIIDNGILRNKSLSIQARMLYALLQSYPKEWVVNLKAIAEILNISLASVRKYRNELVDNGLLTYTQSVDSEGRFTQEMIYTFKHTQAQEIAENTQSLPITQKTASGDSSTLNNIEYINKKDSKERAQKKLLFTLLTSYKTFRDESKTKRTQQTKLPTDFNEQERASFSEFINYRKERGFLAKSTLESITRDFSKLKQSGANIKACVDLCINRGWSGILKANEALNRYESYKKTNFYQVPKTPRPIDTIKF